MPFLHVSDRSCGSILPMFGLAIVPAVGLMGAAVDYDRAASVRTAMQGALDATSLFLSKDAANLTAAQLTARAQKLFEANFENGAAKGVSVAATYTTMKSGWSVKITSSGTVDTTLSRVLGHNDVGSSSEVV